MYITSCIWYTVRKLCQYRFQSSQCVCVCVCTCCWVAFLSLFLFSYNLYHVMVGSDRIFFWLTFSVFCYGRATLKNGVLQAVNWVLVERQDMQSPIRSIITWLCLLLCCTMSVSSVVFIICFKKYNYCIVIALRFSNIELLS